MRICIVSKVAAHYRKSIYQRLDLEYDCFWYFGDKYSDIKSMDITFLKECHIIENKHLFGNFYLQKGLSQILNISGCNTYLIGGEPYNISVWIILLKAFFKKGKKVYLWTHGWYGKEPIFKSLIKRVFFRLVDGIFVYGDYSRELMVQKGFNPNKIWTIHNSLDYENQHRIRKSLLPSTIYNQYFNNSKKVLIFIGRLTGIKRLDILIRAMTQLKTSYNLILVGDGEKRKDLESMVSEFNLEKSVWFYGPSYDEVTNANLIFNADLCIAPGNIGLTAMHSMVYGTPCISHNNFSRQMPEFEAIKVGKTGAFFQQDNVDSLVLAIENWFSNPNYDRDSIRSHCFKEIDEFWTPDFQMEVFKKYLTE